MNARSTIRCAAKGIVLLLLFSAFTTAASPDETAVPPEIKDIEGDSLDKYMRACPVLAQEEEVSAPRSEHETLWRVLRKGGFLGIGVPALCLILAFSGFYFNLAKNRFYGGILKRYVMGSIVLCIVATLAYTLWPSSDKIWKMLDVHVISASDEAAQRYVFLSSFVKRHRNVTLRSSAFPECSIWQHSSSGWQAKEGNGAINMTLPAYSKTRLLAHKESARKKWFDANVVLVPESRKARIKIASRKPHSFSSVRVFIPPTSGKHGWDVVHLSRPAELSGKMQSFPMELLPPAEEKWLSFIQRIHKGNKAVVMGIRRMTKSAEVKEITEAGESAWTVRLQLVPLQTRPPPTKHITLSPAKITVSDPATEEKGTSIDSEETSFRNKQLMLAFPVAQEMQSMQEYNLSQAKLKVVYSWIPWDGTEESRCRVRYRTDENAAPEKMRTLKFLPVDSLSRDKLLAELRIFQSTENTKSGLSVKEPDGNWKSLTGVQYIYRSRIPTTAFHDKAKFLLELIHEGQGPKVMVHKTELSLELNRKDKEVAP